MRWLTHPVSTQKLVKMQTLWPLMPLSLLTAAVLSVTYDNYSRDCNVALLDEAGTEYQLITFANRVAVTLAPQWCGQSWNSIFLYRWIYDPATQRLMTCANHESCLVANPDLHTLSLSNCSANNHNQKFVYNQAQRELFWINPTTQRQHPVYLEKDGGRTVKMVPYLLIKPFISRNPISKSISDQIRKFSNSVFIDAPNQIVSNPRGFRLRALTLHSLHKSLPNMSSFEHKKYVEMIESLNGPEFGYFMNKYNGYLISDGHKVNSMHWCRFKNINYHYYGLWNINNKNQLIHFLSGKYLQAIPNYSSRNIKMLGNMLQPGTRNSHQAFFSSRANETFYDLKLSEYAPSKESTFVTVARVKEQQEMYVNNMGFAQKIQRTMIAHGVDAYLAFVNNSTFQRIRSVVWGTVAFENQENMHGRWASKLKRYHGLSFSI